MKHTLSSLLALLALLSGLFLTSCKGDDVAAPTIAPIYKWMAEWNDISPDKRDSIIGADAHQLAVMTEFLGLPFSESGVSEWSRSQAVKVFTPDVLAAFPSLEPLQRDLAYVINKGLDEGIAFPVRHYGAVVWGSRRAMVLTDSCMLIALNHYLGPDYPGYGGWPQYERLQKAPSRLPYDMAEAMVANLYPYEKGDEPTVLSRLVYEGALTLAKVRLAPDGDLAGALGYTDAQLQWLKNHSKDIWATLVSNNLLYSTREDEADRLVLPAPFTAQLGPEAPARAGRYVGYCIVLAYLRGHSATTLPELLSPGFYNNPSLLIESAYEG